MFSQLITKQTKANPNPGEKHTNLFFFLITKNENTYDEIDKKSKKDHLRIELIYQQVKQQLTQA